MQLRREKDEAIRFKPREMVQHVAFDGRFSNSVIVWSIYMWQSTLRWRHGVEPICSVFMCFYARVLKHLEQNCDGNFIITTAQSSRKKSRICHTVVAARLSKVVVDIQFSHVHSIRRNPRKFEKTRGKDRIVNLCCHKMIWSPFT